MKRLIFFALAVLIAGNALAANTLSIMEDGKILPQYLPTVSLVQDGDPAEPFAGQMWWNNSTNQLKVAGALGIYEFNATSMVAWDTTPDAFTFTDWVNATTETVYTSDPITVAGINWPAAISVSGDATAKYRVNDGVATATAGTVEVGDTVQAVVTSSASGSTAVNATVTIGGVSDAYSVTTAAAPLVDEDFEGTGTPSGWTGSGFQTGAVDYDYTTGALAGSQSARLYTTSGGYYGITSPTFSGSVSGNTVYFRVKSSSVPSYTNNWAAINNSGTRLAEFVTSSSGNIGVKVGGEISFGGTVMSINTAYYLKLEYVPGTGANSVARVSVWNGSSWTVEAGITNGDRTLTADRCEFNHPNTSTDQTLYDSILVR